MLGLLVVCSIIAAAGDLLLAVLPHTADSARYGAIFLVLSGILSGITLSVGNITHNCCETSRSASPLGCSKHSGARWELLQAIYSLKPLDLTTKSGSGRCLELLALAELAVLSWQP